MGCLVSESILEYTVGAGKLNDPLVLGHSILCWYMKRYHRVLKVSFPRLPLFRSRVINEVSTDGETYMNRPHYHPLQRDQQYSLSVPAALQDYRELTPELKEGFGMLVAHEVYLRHCKFSWKNMTRRMKHQIKAR